MAGNNYFQFKQFTIFQEKSAMKVGIDGVLLGAWTNLEAAHKILDVGTGTGLIALMLAQRSFSSHIDAIEIDINAYEEACTNSNNSAWAERVHVKQISLQEYAAECQVKYDLIVSNPPYFENSVKTKSESRDKARNSTSLTLNELLSETSKILAPKGRLALIFPFDRKEELIETAKKFDYMVQRLTNIAPHSGKKYHRILVEFGYSNVTFQESELMLREMGKSEYSADYKELLKDFYLKF